MIYAIITDVHGNIDAAEAVLGFLKSRDIGALVVPGDIVGYGARPAECIDAFSAAGAVFLRGNHEEAVAAGTSAGFTDDAAASLEWTMRALPGRYTAALAHWQASERRNNFLFCHTLPVENLSAYIRSRADAARAFSSETFDVCFLGHTHFPSAFSLARDGSAPRLIAEEPDGTMAITFREDERYIVNAGSAGQPRDGNPAACCGLYDDRNRSFRLHRIPYDTGAARQKIIQAGLPRFLGDRLLKGV